MRRPLGGIFFIAAAIYIGTVKIMDAITLSSMLACTLLAVLVGLTRYYKWTVVAGALVIITSLAMQLTLGFICADCIRADALILCGIIYLSFLTKGKIRVMNTILSTVMFALLFVMAAISIPTDLDPSETLEPKVERHITMTNGQVIDTKNKPVLIFSTRCSACKQAVNKLIEVDPNGDLWTPIQSSGSLEEGKAYLEQCGYNGELYRTNWRGSVPTMIVTSDDGTAAIRSVEKMLAVVSTK